MVIARLGPEAKAALLREHLDDGVPLSRLAEHAGVSARTLLVGVRVPRHSCAVSCRPDNWENGESWAGWSRKQPGTRAGREHAWRWPSLDWVDRRPCACRRRRSTRRAGGGVPGPLRLQLGTASAGDAVETSPTQAMSGAGLGRPDRAAAKVKVPDQAGKTACRDRPAVPRLQRRAGSAMIFATVSPVRASRRPADQG